MKEKANKYKHKILMLGGSSDKISKIEDQFGDEEMKKYVYNHMAPNPKIMKSWGWSNMPPNVWSVPQQRPPACIPQKSCPVCPQQDSRYADAMQWNSVGSIMPKFEFKEL